MTRTHKVPPRRADSSVKGNPGRDFPTSGRPGAKVRFHGRLVVSILRMSALKGPNSKQGTSVICRGNTFETFIERENIAAGIPCPSGEQRREGVAECGEGEGRVVPEDHV